MVGSAEQLSLPFENKPLYHRDDFVIAPSNISAYHLVNNWPDWGFASACIIGAKGAGKTHLASIWQSKSQAYRVSAKNIGEGFALLTAGSNILLEDLTYGDFIEKELFHLFNNVVQARVVYPQVSLLITAQTSPLNWPMELKDLLSRFRAIPKIAINPPEDMVLAAIMGKLFSDMQVRVDSKLIDYAVSRMERSIEFAVDFVNRCNVKALAEKSKITKTIIEAVLTELMTKAGRNQ
ncbi:hypothetical protein [Bartonella sp. TP]|uniref:hypothetical protein n=1 Tax=Bartonella sp. TP TaxID=3057550 RepID=UPI0025B1967E|nr:hypothetical protein [Bartonella sp. TP]WJW79895.1 hypothetical protein QVL57_05165 [Bartonella sp. TP]